MVILLEAATNYVYIKLNKAEKNEATRTTTGHNWYPEGVRESKWG